MTREGEKAMTTAEAIEKLRKMGIGGFVQGNLDFWAAQGAFHGPTDGEWGDWAVAMAAAGLTLILDIAGWSGPRVVQVRRLLGETLEKGLSFVDALNKLDCPDPPAEWDPANPKDPNGAVRIDGFIWGILTLKAYLGLPLRDPVTLIESMNEDGRASYMPAPPARTLEFGQYLYRLVDRIVRDIPR